LGKSGAGKGKFDFDFVHEREPDSIINPALKVSAGSFSKNNAANSSMTRTMTSGYLNEQVDPADNMDWFEDLKKGLLKAFKDFPALETPEDLY
jgi:hypothetical protein